MRKMACPDSLSKEIYQKKAISSRAFAQDKPDAHYLPSLPRLSSPSAAPETLRRESDTNEEPSTESKLEATESKEETRQD